MNIGKVRSSNGFMRTVASIVVVAYLNLIVSPGVQAMEQAAARERLHHEERSNLGKALQSARDKLRVLAERRDVSARQATREQRRAVKEALRAWGTQNRALIEEVQAEFADTEELIARKKLPEVIKQRHAEAKAKFEAEAAAFDADLSAALEATDEAVEQQKAEAALRRLEGSQLGRSQQEFDPNNLPNSTLKPDRTRTPKTSTEAFQAALLASEPAAQFAQAGEFDFSQLPGANDPSYLEDTTEVVLTADIQAKAEELNHNPVEIYNWVRNNVHWLPTWGAIQDASHTLSSQRGNAFDIASLTIALLRASGIPARYVYGTIDVPEEKFRNWAGGFQSLEAALDFASAGGMAVTAVTSGGRATKVRIEHIWVEAAIDFVPSRGVRNRSADSWAAIDPSFKQYEFLDGLDVLEVAAVDPAQLADSFLASGTLNGSDASITGFDASILHSAQAQARTAIEQHLTETQATLTVGEVLGGRRIVQQAAPALAIGLPNSVTTAGVRFAAVPASLQQRITLAFGRDVLGDPINPVSFPWARLNNKNVTLSFRPATQADRDAIEALLPEGEITDYRQLPTTMPAYLIAVVPELKIDGTTVLSGSSMRLGDELTFVFNPRFVSAGERPFSYRLPAGSYLSVAVFGGTVSPSEAAGTEVALRQLRSTLEAPGNPAADSLTRDELLGYQYRGALLNYYGLYQLHGEILAEKLGGRFTLAAGLGTFGYEPDVDTFFGIPRTLRAGSSVFNIPMVNIVGSSTGEVGLSRTVTMQLGVLSSALEHDVPEKSDPTTPAISATKAFELAAEQGSRIFGADRTNVDAALAQTALDSDARSEVRAAINAGRIAVLHSGLLAIPGWSGAGYAIIDPVTGSGAYKISGGQNGGVQQVADGITLAAAGASGYLDATVGRYAGRDFWFSERLKYLSKMGNTASNLGYLGLGLSALVIWTDDTLSTSEKILRTCTEMLFFGITAHLTGAIAAAVAAPIGTVALPLVLGVALSVAVTMAMTYALLAINLIYFARLDRYDRFESRWG